MSDEADKIWYWNYNDFKLYYDTAEEVRLKVLDISYKSTNEIASYINNNKTADFNSDFLANKTNIAFENVIEVVGTFNQEGLGPVKWWQSQ